MSVTSEQLPEECFGVNLVEQAVVRLKRGESGYWPATGPSEQPQGTEDLDACANRLNAELGVSVAQRKAMEMGSIFGFDVPGANPAKWTNEGKPVR